MAQGVGRERLIPRSAACALRARMTMFRLVVLGTGRDREMNQEVAGKVEAWRVYASNR